MAVPQTSLSLVRFVVKLEKMSNAKKQFSNLEIKTKNVFSTLNISKFGF